MQSIPRSGHRRILAGDGLSAYDPKATSDLNSFEYNDAEPRIKQASDRRMNRGLSAIGLEFRAVVQEAFDAQF